MCYNVPKARCGHERLPIRGGRFFIRSETNSSLRKGCGLDAYRLNPFSLTKHSDAVQAFKPC